MTGIVILEENCFTDSEKSGICFVPVGGNPGLGLQHTSLILDISMLCSSYACQNKLTAVQCHVNILEAQA